MIDDDPVTRKVIKRGLEKNNFNIIEASGASEGYDKLNEVNIDLVLCDVVMNDMDGYEFCTKVRKEERYKALPFIFITSRNSIEDKSHALFLGADDFVSKPVKFDELSLKINSLLKRVEIYKLHSVKFNIESSLETESSRILIVDDDPMVAAVITAAMSDLNIECLKENNASDALSMLSNTFPKPDLILSDLMMPEMDGFEFRKKILKDPLLKEIPFVFLTSNEEEDVLLQGYDLEIKDFIIKTDKPKVIAVKISNLIRNIKRDKNKVIAQLKSAADSITMEVVPKSAPKLEGFDIKHWYIPYKGTPGGDFIDYIPINDNRVAIILGDIMGKQWGAWFFAFSFIGYIRSSIRVVLDSDVNLTAGDLLAKVNNSIFKDAKISEVFSTVSCVIVDNKEMSFEYSGAGDLAAFHYIASENKVDQYTSAGLLLGLSPDNTYDNITSKARPGDYIVIYSDGITESRNKSGELFGQERVLEILLTKSDKDKITQIKEIFNEFTGGIYDDDISLIVIEVK